MVLRGDDACIGGLPILTRGLLLSEPKMSIPQS